VLPSTASRIRALATFAIIISPVRAGQISRLTILEAFLIKGRCYSVHHSAELLCGVRI
jgi:hypothetical protein